VELDARVPGKTAPYLREEQSQLYIPRTLLAVPVIAVNPSMLRLIQRDAQRVCTVKSNWREGVLPGSHVCKRHREPLLPPRPMTLFMALFMALS